MVGICSYGAYLPRYARTTADIAKLRSGADAGPALGLTQKTVPSDDEDTATIAVEASLQSISRSGIDREQIRGLWIGSESHPYAVKPTGTIVASALGLSDQLSMADLQFACKAGTAALQLSLAYASAGWGDYYLAIGADTAQANSGDVLEFTAAAGGAAFLVGRENLVAQLEETVSVATDTPDFWRRNGQYHPQHAGRFTGEPAYFAHINKSVALLLEKAGRKIGDFDHCVFHTPNGKFPRQVATALGCSPKQLQYSLIVEKIGNTYAGASLLALANVLDQAKADELILVASYGSGAGSDAFIFRTTDELVQRRAQWKDFVQDRINKLEIVS